ncbi:GNAT family N-acetyltransferase [Actinopolymorpha singaporensis]|uniref:Acetyltransferase (GNAT) family protein n=1 Tax=Actinopolymorpha singaporensis TaxID=117157 RepID=A0A1H1TUP1_9ACTN|nr:GNAT family N-acetyltransferase [Actinopolymorpha singaporensis]SDS63329.1 Acetyltransferase (GNAT) family protein [Actinopolymorpha singaporensis]
MAPKTPSPSKPVGFTTRELSVRTLADFERFFSQVHGCACVVYYFGRHLPPVANTAGERAEILGAPDRARRHFPHRELMRTREQSAVSDLVRRGRADGILVYAAGDPVGWCQFARVEGPPTNTGDLAPLWRINCFTTRMDYRRQGVATTALKSAVAAIRKRGGGWVEARPMAFPHYDPTLPKLRRTYGWRSPEAADYIRDNWPSKEIPGIGRVNACQVTNKTMGHMGTMSMFEKLGFAVVGLDEERSSNDPRYPWHFVLMRLKV